ncbi:hypothetical protein ES703_34154 [subsurface metagenome]
MLWTLVPLIPIGLVVYVIAYFFDREDARARADELITGIRKPTPEDIDKCMLRLEVANIRLLSRNETDRRRVELLRDICSKCVTSDT